MEKKANLIKEELTKEKRIQEIETKMQSPDFWQNSEEAQKWLKELNWLKNEIQKTKQYDKGSALMEIFSGAGGVDAQDWAGMLFRMYQRYAEKNRFSFKVLQESWGEQRGLKSATVEIKGPHAYGYLKNESGVHRLVRLSPFSAKNLRHTSFALVQFTPLVEEAKFQIDPKDLRIDTFRSSGPCGQNVNKLETAVRITHIPSGIMVAVQSERSQGQNKEKAMQIPISRLAQKMEESKIKELSELKSEKREIEWGSQIRSYVLNPYQMVKAHRTGIKSSQPDKILDGDLDKFIKSEIKTTK